MTTDTFWPDLDPEEEAEYPTIPQVREMLIGLAVRLSMGLVDTKEAANEIKQAVSYLYRRPSRDRAPNDSTPMTPMLRLEIRSFALQHPEMTELAIGQVFGVNQGRVSEALQGFRR